jgi:hypothetical protein
MIERRTARHLIFKKLYRATLIDLLTHDILQKNHGD